MVYKWAFLMALLVLEVNGFGQGKVIIPKEEKIDLPTNQQREVELSAEMDETHFSPMELKKLFIEESAKYFDSSSYFLVDSFGKKIEYFVLEPCMVFELKSMTKDIVKAEGIITSSVKVSFGDSSYLIEAKNYEWVDLKNNKHSVSKMYDKYKQTKSLKERIKMYGVLKSAEYSIVESFDTITVIIDEIISKKSGEMHIEK